MGFIVGVLVIGALLSAIFGRRVGQFFVLGTGTIILLGIGIVLVLLSPLIWDYFHEPSHVQSASKYGDYQPGYSYHTTYPNTGSQQPTGTTGNSGAASPPEAASPYAPPSPPPPATGTGPRIGVDLAEVPAYTVQQLTYLHVPPGAGTWISVQPGSPAEGAGLNTYDVILSAGAQGQPADWITPSNQLPSYLGRVGYNVPVRLHVYRATERRDFWTWVHPR